ncbi:HTTM domain-containing protein [Leucobacter albus]|uniref:HTTM domain-containing protein n=1 Tax=Leucobacter albus TaxID=272210 RepID=UPI0031DEAE49
MTRTISGLWAQLSAWLMDARRATYGLALLRIGLGASTVVILALYLPNLSYTFGRGSQWGQALFRDSSVHSYAAPIGWFFSRGEPDELLVVKTIVLMAVAVAYALGWRMRVISPLFVVLWLGFSTLDPVVTNTGHYQTFRLFIIFLLFADTSFRWSLDSLRRTRNIARHGDSWIPPRFGLGKARLPEWVPVLSNNIAAILIGYQLCVIYVTSALWKMQGATWVTGVAAYYPLQVEELTLFPWLNHLAWQITPAVFVASWVSIYGQLLFPLMLLNRWTRILGLVLVTGMHASIAILLALPWFSLMMILGDMVFVRDQTWRRCADWVKQRIARRRSAGVRSRSRPASAGDASDASDASGASGASDVSNVSNALSAPAGPR